MRDTSRRSRPFWYLRRRPEAIASEVDEELRLHLEMRAQELQAAGLSDEAAEGEALRQFGDLEATRQYCRQQDERKETTMQRGLILEDLAQDLRVSLRGLLRAPLTAATIVATVGLGIAATTVIFSAVHAAFLQPLPYDAPDRLVRIYTDAPPNKFRFSVADYQALEAQQTEFAQVAGYREQTMAWSDGQLAERVRGREVSWTYFGLLGIRPALGQDFTAADGRPGAPPAVMVSHGFWQRRLGGRHDLVGSTVRLDGADYRLAGVLPPAVGPLEQGQEFFVAARWAAPPRRGPFPIIVLGRLRPGSSPDAAAGELRAISMRIFPIWQASYQNERAAFALMDLKTYVVGDVQTMAGLALAAVGLVWLIACTNASNLLVARVTSRKRELAVRAALGASRGRVVRHLLAESVLLAAGAASVGLALAWAGVTTLRTAGAGYFPRTAEIALGGPVLWLLAVLTLVSALLFGLIPALQGSEGSVEQSLRASGRSATGSIRVRRLRQVLVATQFAIATPLLVVAGLLLASLNQLARVDLGFDTRNVLTGSVDLPKPQYPEPARVNAFWDEFTRRVEALPGVTGVALADGRPPEDVDNFNNFDLEAFPAGPGGSQPVTPWVAVTPAYFRVLGLSLREGRLLDERDAQTEELESVVVDHAWATRFFPKGDAVGKRFREGGCTTCPWTTVVGVVSGVKYAGLDAPDEGTVYSPMAPGARSRYLVLRLAGDAAAAAPALRQALHDLDPSLPLSSVATMDELVAQSLQRPRSLSLLIGGFALVALVLSLVGIYGVMAYSVQQQAKEITIRLALGGDRRDVCGLVVGQSMRIAASGVAIGLLAALAGGRLLSRLLFGVGASDLKTLATVTLLMLAAALLACFVPARRAMGLEPAVLLRND